MRVQPSPHLSLMTFKEFLENHQSAWTLLSVYSWYIFVSICTVLIPYTTETFSSFSSLRFLGFIPISIHGYHHLQQKYFSSSWPQQPLRLYQIGDFFLLITTILSCAALLQSSATGSCHVALCVPEIGTRQFQPYLLLQHVIIPIIGPVLLKAHSKWCAYLLYLLSFSITILSAVLINISLPGYFSLAVFYLLEMIIVYDNEATLAQLYSHYLTGEQHLQMKMKTIQEREMLLVQGEEASAFYGNVAHDLKSPLQGFTTELETLEKNFCPNSPSSPSAAASAFPFSPPLSFRSASSSVGGAGSPMGRGPGGGGGSAQLRESIVVMKSICCFMLMTINRAIDYSKAATGKLLIPTLEPVNLSEAICWVVKCVSPLNDMPIKIEPLSDSISVHVVTDKLWLMENLLCLVSNALKFTVGDGSVLVRCFLQAKWTMKSGLQEDDEQGRRPPRVPFLNLRALHNPTDSSSGISGETADRETPMVVVLEVEDSGNETKLGDLISLFHPHKPTIQRKEGGTGLGLYSILKRVEALGGSCGVKSRRDGTPGSRFWFSFPYEPSQPLLMSFSSFRDINVGGLGFPLSPTARERGGDDDGGGEEIGGIPKRILLVEDSVLIQKTTSRALRNEGYVVDVARNGSECLKMVTEQQHPYGLVLMDIQMPVMDGIEATKRIREMERVQQSPSAMNCLLSPRRSGCHQIIIGLSANSDPETMTDALAAGMDAFIPKPLTAKALKQCFKRLMISRV
jgi:CheY-like chemotaxis protein